MSEVLDSRAPWITVTRAVPPCWQLVQFEYRDGDESGGDVNTYIVAADEAGYTTTYEPDGRWFVPRNPVDGLNIQVVNGGTTLMPTNKNADGRHHGEVDFPKTAGSNFDPGKNQLGAYTVSVKDALPSDSVGKLGLPLNRHVSETLMFAKVLAAPEPPPEPPPGEEEPDFWAAVRAVSNQIPPAQFLLFPYAGQTFQLTRTGDGGVFAVGVEQKINMYMMLADEVLKT